ncbi:MAG: membrane protein insertion efficiency factor YidD [Proteobacteria bacterium]|nr:membrane protein insertion efficiency factor YidD [Pseudomonadota bacterium]
MTHPLSKISLRGIQATIWLYQHTLSPDHGPLRFLFPAGACRYHPTCSVYMSQAIHHHEWRGLIHGVRRILRCHPFADGGEDPVKIKVETQ